MLVHKHIAHKRKHKKQEVTSLDKLMYFVCFAYPFTAIPQLYKIYTSHNVTSLSLLTWVLYVFFGLVFLAYAVSKKLKPLIIEGALWVVVYVLMVIAIIIYS